VSNRRNGQQSKTVRNEYGPVELETSRDRNGSFDPKLIGKQERQLSHVTDSVSEEMAQWRNRPLADQWAIVYFDGIRYKIRSGGQVVSVTVYAAIGIDMEGKRDVLGFYLSETESGSPDTQLR